MKIALTALVTAAACFALTAATGLASHSSQKAQVSEKATVVVRIGDYVKVPALDLACLYQPHDTSKQEQGPVLYCDRPSDTNPDSKAAALLISKSHFKVSATGASSWTATIWRHP